MKTPTLSNVIENLSSELYVELEMALESRKHQLMGFLGLGEEELDYSKPYSAASQLRRIDELSRRLKSARYPETFAWRD